MTLTRTQITVLECIERISSLTKGKFRLSSVCNDIEKSPQNVYSIVKKLEKQGFVKHVSHGQYKFKKSLNSC